MEPEGELEREPGVATAAARSAERQIALAATEGFHPLRVRPYVAEPGTEGAESTVKPLVGTVAPRPAATDVGMFPADGLEYPADDPGGPTDGSGHAADPHDSGLLLGRTGGADWDDTDGPGQHRGGRRRRPRRRGRGLVVAAATVAATAMAAGAVAVANQLLSAPERPDRGMPDNTSSVPDVVLPTADATAAAATTAARGKAPKSSPTATHRGPTTPVTTPPATVAPVSATPSPPPATADAPAADPAVPGPDASPTVTPSSPATHPTIAVPALRLGDTGAAVKDLQQRLRRAYVYRGDVDGVFDSGVRDAVAMFQFWNAISSDPEGVYGPATRTALERQTSW